MRGDELCNRRGNANPYPSGKPRQKQALVPFHPFSKLDERYPVFLSRLRMKYGVLNILHGIYLSG